jgi:GNAT superfamily N-acetyltransferase
MSTALLDRVIAGYSLVAEVAGRIVALASSYLLPDRSQVEVGLVVDDLNQRRGIGTVLFASLSRDAQRAGIRRLRAEILASNRGMLRVLQDSGLPMTRTAARDAVEVVIELRQADA